MNAMRAITASIVLLGTAIGASCVYVLQPAVAVPPPCLGSDVQAHIIRAERPGMGPRELNFWVDALRAAAEAHKVDALVFTALVAHESHFRGQAISHKGAKGAAQLMPVWSKDIDPFDIETNLQRGAEVLRKYIDEGKHLRAGLRRYNGGPRGEDILSTGAYADAILARVYLAEKAVCQRSPIQGEA